MCAVRLQAYIPEVHLSFRYHSYSIGVYPDRQARKRRHGETAKIPFTHELYRQSSVPLTQNLAALLIPISSQPLRFQHRHPELSYFPHRSSSL